MATRAFAPISPATAAAEPQALPHNVEAEAAMLGAMMIDNRLADEYREWVYLVQYGESDFNFVARLMEQEGIFFFSHSQGSHTLVEVLPTVRWGYHTFCLLSNARLMAVQPPANLSATLRTLAGGRFSTKANCTTGPPIAITGNCWIARM